MEYDRNESEKKKFSEDFQMKEVSIKENSLEETMQKLEHDKIITEYDRIFTENQLLQNAITKKNSVMKIEKKLSVEDHIRNEIQIKLIQEKLITLYETMQIFKSEWDKKNPCKTSKRLQELDFDCGQVIRAFLEYYRNSKNASEAIGCLYLTLGKYDSQQLKKIVRIPSHISKEQKTNLVVRRVDFIQTWEWFQNQLNPERFKKQFPEFWNKYYHKYNEI